MTLGLSMVSALNVVHTKLKHLMNTSIPLSLDGFMSQNKSIRLMLILEPLDISSFCFVFVGKTDFCWRCDYLIGNKTSAFDFIEKYIGGPVIFLNRFFDL